jgi:transcriptional regulator with XRE-family HTH domain
MTGSEFEELRLQLGLSVSEMAAIIGVTPREIQNFERGRSPGVRRAVMAAMRRLLRLPTQVISQTARCTKNLYAGGN